MQSFYKLTNWDSEKSLIKFTYKYGNYWIKELALQWYSHHLLKEALGTPSCNRLREETQRSTVICPKAYMFKGTGLKIWPNISHSQSSLLSTKQKDHLYRGVYFAKRPLYHEVYSFLLKEFHEIQSWECTIFLKHCNNLKDAGKKNWCKQKKMLLITR